MRIAVVGIGIVSALGLGARANIEAIRSGRCGITTKPQRPEVAEGFPVGEVPASDEELHIMYGIPLKRHMSRTALLGIAAVKEAMKDAGIRSGERIGIVSSTTVSGMDLSEHFYREFMKNNARGRLRDIRMHDCAASTLAIAEWCGIDGYSTTLSTACSSGANAIIAGARLLQHGMADCIVAGGTDCLTQYTVNGFKSLMILDRNICRPFDSSHAGINLGEGAGYIVLRREEESGQRYCFLSGYANYNDAFHQTALSDMATGPCAAISGALSMAGVESSDIGYINAHGSGTINNDTSECRALMNIFGDNIPPFSSTKGFTGHTLAAAGGIEAALAALSVKYGYIYPNIHFRTPENDSAPIPETSFRDGADIKCAISNSFGFSGNCVSLVFTGL